MNINFSKEDILLILGKFDKMLVQVEELNDMDNPPISRKNLKQDIEMYSSVVNKIVTEYPEFSIIKQSKS